MKNYIENVATWGFLVFAGAFVVSILVLLVRFFIWAFSDDFWVALSVLMGLLMIVCVLVIRFLPEKR